MASEVIKREGNHRTVAAGVSNDASQDILMFRVDPVTGYVLVDVTIVGSSSANSVSIASRDENHRPVCLAYDESNNILCEVLTDSSGNLLCDIEIIP